MFFINIGSFYLVKVFFSLALSFYLSLVTSLFSNYRYAPYKWIAFKLGEEPKIEPEALPVIESNLFYLSPMILYTILCCFLAYGFSHASKRSTIPVIGLLHLSPISMFQGHERSRTFSTAFDAFKVRSIRSTLALFLAATSICHILL